MAGQSSHRKIPRSKAGTYHESPFVVIDEDGPEGSRKKSKTKAPPFPKGACSPLLPTSSKRSQLQANASVGTLEDEETEDDDEAEYMEDSARSRARLGWKEDKPAASDSCAIFGGRIPLKLSGPTASRYGSLGPVPAIQTTDDQSILSFPLPPANDEESGRGEDDEEQNADSEADVEIDFHDSDKASSDDEKHLKKSDILSNGGDESALGDIYLEYTDFDGADFPITWSEADDAETVVGGMTDVETQPQEFADILLMDAHDEESPLYLTNLQKIANDQASSESDFSDETSYFTIEEFGGTDGASLSDSKSTDDGATTDSLDEDDHSGLVRFGIEVDDDDDDATFFDIPQDADISAVLSGLNETGGLYFLVEGGESAQHGNLDPGLPLSRPQASQTVLPVMGSFETSKSETGHTIINVQSKAIPSPFSGGKVIRYNRFKKLKQQARARSHSAASASASIKSVSMSADPAPNLAGPLELPTASTDGMFDITAFIRGISSKDGSDDEVNESGMDTDRQLDALSRWNKVPMSAFRRSTMASPHWTEGLNHQHLNEAVHRHRGPTSLSKTLSPLDPLLRKTRSSNQTASLSLQGTLRPSPRGSCRNPRSRKEQRAMKKKAKLMATMPQTTPSRQPARSNADQRSDVVGEMEFNSDAALYGAFESPLFKNLSGTVDDVPMLDLGSVNEGR